MPSGVYVRKSHHKTGKFERTIEQKEILKKRFQEQALLKKGKKRPPFTKEWKRNLSEAQKGRIPWNKGKKGEYSEEYRKKIKIARANQVITEKHRINLSNAGKAYVATGKHHLWKGGIYPENLALRKSLKYKFWREAVFKRDNFTCVLCGSKKSGNLEADHIKSFSLYPELRFDIDNGRTLCKKCHRKTDTYGPQKRVHPKKKEITNHEKPNFTSFSPWIDDILA